MFAYLQLTLLDEATEVSGACGELVMKTGSKDAGSAYPIAGSLRLVWA